MLTTLFNFAFSNSYRSCQCMQYNSGKGTCYYFTNKEAGACSSRQCEPSYVCDKKGLLLCREKTYPTKIVPHGNGYCKEVQYQTVKLEPYASVVKPGVPLVFRTARAQSIDQGGDPMRVIRSQHQCVWPGSCMMTKVGTSPWFLGYLRDISRVSSITLTFRRDREFYRKQPQLRVYVDGFQCTPERRPTYDNPKVKYDCGDAIGYRVIVYLPGKNQVLSFCGIDAIGTPVQKSSIKFAPQSATSSGHLYGVSPNNVFTLPHKQKWTGTCYHSTRSNYPWWRAHLAQRSIVQTILIYARSDNFASALHRYKGLQVYADRTACTLVKWSSKEAILYYQCQDVPVATTITVKSALKNVSESDLLSILTPCTHLSYFLQFVLLTIEYLPHLTLTFSLLRSICTYVESTFMVSLVLQLLQSKTIWLFPVDQIAFSLKLLLMLFAGYSTMESILAIVTTPDINTDSCLSFQEREIAR